MSQSASDIGGVTEDGRVKNFATNTIDNEGTTYFDCKKGNQDFKESNSASIKNETAQDDEVNPDCHSHKAASSIPEEKKIAWTMNTNDPSFRLVLLTLMVVQNSCLVLFGRYSRADKTKEELYVVNDLILICETLKFIISCGLEYKTTNGKLVESIKENVIDAPFDALKILIPSMLYLLQNTLQYVALSNLSAPLFQVTYQSKLLTTALVSVIMLHRRYSLKQWICLTLLGIGVAIVVLGEKKDDNKEHGKVKMESAGHVATQSLAIGLISVTVACCSSALAGVYFEKVLKKPTSVATQDGQVNVKNPVSLWMRNIQMAFFSVIIAIVNGMITTGPDSEKKFMHGFTRCVWIVILLQAGGGMLVAAVIKYADNVLKGLATGVSVVLATACSMVFFDTPLTGQFVLGSTIILSSVYFFSNNLPFEKPKPQKEEIDVELQKPLVKTGE